MLLTVFCGHSSFWGLGITASRCLSFRVVDSLSWPLTVFQSFSFNCYFWLLTYSLPVVGGRQRYFVCFHITQIKLQGRWQSFNVVHGRCGRLRAYPSDPVVGCLSGLLLVFAKIPFMFPYGRSQFLMKLQIQ